jgi:hypothetical protein
MQLSCLLDDLDPQTSVRPKVRDGQRIGTGRTETAKGKGAALLCDAQGYPRPSYRYIIER